MSCVFGTPKAMDSAHRNVYIKNPALSQNVRETYSGSRLCVFKVRRNLYERHPKFDLTKSEFTATTSKKGK